MFPKIRPHRGGAAPRSADDEKIRLSHDMGSFPSGWEQLLFGLSKSGTNESNHDPTIYLAVRLLEETLLAAVSSTSVATVGEAHVLY